MSLDNGTNHRSITNAFVPYMNGDESIWAQHSMLSPISISTVLPSVINETLDRNELPLFLDSASSHNAVAMVFLVLVLLVIIVGTIVGNILVCVAVGLVKKLRRPYNYLIVSLAVSDLCVAILVMPMALLHEFLGQWQFGRMACDIWVSFDVLSCTASILNLCMISVDRYMAITRPLDYGVKRTPRRMVAYILFVWLGAAFISVPPVLILGNEHGQGDICQVCQNFWYQIYATFGSFYIPLAVMVMVYYKIFQAAQRIVREEKKAQAHLKLMEEQNRCRTPLPMPIGQFDRNKMIPNNQEQQRVSSRRCSVVQINNGEVETKLASYLPLGGTTDADWTPTSTEGLLRNNLNRSNHQRHPQDKNYQSQYEESQQLLKVPMAESRHLSSNSPMSTTTSCESSWSLDLTTEQTKGDVVSVTLNPSFDNSGGGGGGSGDTSECQIVPIKGENEINILSRTPPPLDKNQRFSQKCREEQRNQTPCKVTVNCVQEEDKTKTNTALEVTPTTVEVVDQSQRRSVCQGGHRNESDASTQALLGKNTTRIGKRHSSLDVIAAGKKVLGLPKSKLRITLAKESKASTTLGIIMSAFIVCWLPFFVLALVRPFISEPSAIPNSISSLFLWLGYANSLLNPIIYATLNKDFRKPFQEILCLRCGSLNSLMREEFYHSQYGNPDNSNTYSHVRYNDTIRDHIDNFGPTNYDIKVTRSSSSNQPDTISESRF